MTDRKHILTVVLEDYYHLSPFKGLIQRKQWHRFERRLEIGTIRTLAMLDEFGVRATFFVLGWAAEIAPELIRQVAERGHEVASKGYDHRSIREMSPSQFREDVDRSREALEHATGRSVLGYRVAENRLRRSDFWALDVLSEAGYRYDSSLKPMLRDLVGERWRRFIHLHNGPGGPIWEVPVSSTQIMGFDVPIAGGNYFRQFPRWLVRRAIADWDRTVPAPFVMYFHTWELDPEQPRISSASVRATIRQYRNIRQMEPIIREYLSKYSFQGVADHLGLTQDLRATVKVHDNHLNPTTSAESASVLVRTAISIVVPCYNEEHALPYLANTLNEVQELLASSYQVQFIFVNDGSEDRTREVLEQLFGGRSDCVIVHHQRNRGVMAATLTGMRTATSEIVCCIDCDCTYDPRELWHMLPMLQDGVDLVTASPYHPQGSVRNVPGWRLSLSKSASALYRILSRQKIGTYTSCFRVYRRKTALELIILEPGFLGIAEIITKIDLRGGNIAEYPTMLEARILGYSKMRTFRTIVGHVRLLSRLAWLRICALLPPRLRTFFMPEAVEDVSALASSTKRR